MPAKSISITYFSDVLCIWAYIAELRIKAVQAAFGDQVRLETKFCPVFGDTRRKIATAWKERGGYQGFNAHLKHAAAAFPEISIKEALWLSVRPASSTGAHVFLKAVQLHEAAGMCPPGTSDAAIRATRRAFFEQARDIALQDEHRKIAEETGLDFPSLEVRINDGSAFAALASDYQDAEAAKIPGSPCFVLNEGRQKLYGNVGYRIIEANIEELLREPDLDQCSWC